MNFREWASRSFGFDLRSLALLRIVAPSVYLVELLLHWQYLEAYCTDGGMLPRSVIFESPGTGWSVYLAFGSAAGANFLYCLHILAVVALIAGWKTRLASLTCYFFAFSLQNRFPALPGWETEIRMLFLIGCFLPWGERYSLDERAHPKDPESPDFVVSPATAAWRLQVAILYLASGLLKGGEGWADGTAVEVSLASDGYATPLGLWLLSHLRHYPEMLVALNYAVPLVEIATPIFLVNPWPWVQMGWVVVLCALHAGFGLFLHIGMFSPICCACLVAFVPGAFWKRQTSRMLVLRKPIETVFLGWVSVAMVASFLETLPELKDFVRPLARVPWTTLGLQQHWGMFVPPPFEGGWHVIKGRTLKGEWVDVLHLKPEASEDRPELVYRSYPGVRGYLFLAVHLRSPQMGSPPIREAVAEYYRKRWENAHPGAENRIARLEVLFFKRLYEPGKGFADPERILIYSHDY